MVGAIALGYVTGICVSFALPRWHLADFVTYPELIKRRWATAERWFADNPETHRAFEQSPHSFLAGMLLMNALMSIVWPWYVARDLLVRPIRVRRRAMRIARSRKARQ